MHVATRECETHLIGVVGELGLLEEVGQAVTLADAVAGMETDGDGDGVSVSVGALVPAPRDTAKASHKRTNEQMLVGRNTLKETMLVPTTACTNTVAAGSLHTHPLRSQKVTSWQSRWPLQRLIPS